MTMYSSRYGKDHPWVAGQEVEVYPATNPGEFAALIVRDCPQNNPTNPILVEFRSALVSYGDKSLCLTHYIEYVTNGSVYGWMPSQNDHALRVLSRIAALKKELS